MNAAAHGIKHLTVPADSLRFWNFQSKPLRVTDNERNNNIVLWLGIAAFTIAVGFSIYQSSQPDLSAVANQLKDPDSAEYRNIMIRTSTGYVCGEVNANNSFGAKAGFKSFMIKDGRATIRQRGDHQFDLEAIENCAPGFLSAALVN